MEHADRCRPLAATHSMTISGGASCVRSRTTCSCRSASSATQSGRRGWQTNTTLNAVALFVFFYFICQAAQPLQRWPLATLRLTTAAVTVGRFSEWVGAAMSPLIRHANHSTTSRLPRLLWRIHCHHLDQETAATWAGRSSMLSPRGARTLAYGAHRCGESRGCGREVTQEPPQTAQGWP